MRQASAGRRRPRRPRPWPSHIFSKIVVLGRSRPRLGPRPRSFKNRIRFVVLGRPRPRPIPREVPSCGALVSGLV